MSDDAVDKTDDTEDPNAEVSNEPISDAELEASGPPDQAAAPTEAQQTPPTDATPPSQPPANMPPTPAANYIDVHGQNPPAVNAMHRIAENQMVQQDMATGKITPQTYGSLFNSQTTVGKLGTLFGLLVSGAGSGLAHQSNMVMDMMNNEIKNDLEAQQKNQTNKQTWYSMSMHNDKNIADIEHTNAAIQAQNIGNWDSSMKAARTQQNILEGNAEDAAWNKANPNALQRTLIDMSGANTAYNNMVNATAQMAQDRINRMADGPEKAKAQTVQNTKMLPWRDQQIANKSTEYADQAATVHALKPSPLKKALADPFKPSLDMNTLVHGVQRWKSGDISRMAIDPQNEGLIKQEAGALDTNRTLYGNYNKVFDLLQNMKFSGQVPAASLVSSIVGGLGSMLGTAVGTVAGAPLGPLGALGGAGAGAAAGAAAGNAVSSGGNEAKNTFERVRNILEGYLLQKYDKDTVARMLPAWNDTDESYKLAHDFGTNKFATDASEKNAFTMEKFGLKANGDFPAMPYRAPKNKNAGAAQGKTQSDKLKDLDSMR